jgi:hypothetical protein
MGMEQKVIHTGQVWMDDAKDQNTWCPYNKGAREERQVKLCYGTGQKSDMKSGSGSSKAGQAAY